MCLNFRWKNLILFLEFETKSCEGLNNTVFISYNNYLFIVAEKHLKIFLLDKRYFEFSKQTKSR